MNLKIRRFTKGDEYQISEIIKKDIYKESIKDYSKESLDTLAKRMNPKFILKRANFFHAYVVIDNDKIIGIGMIGPYWDSITESSFFTIFIDPNYIGKGIGRKIIETLEQDEYYKRAERIEIPSSITGLAFYRHFGYGFKKTKDVFGNIVDDEGEYRLEKYPKKSYYNITNTYNIRPYIDNEYHNFKELIYKLKIIKDKQLNIKTMEIYLETNKDNLYIIEFNSKAIGFYCGFYDNKNNYAIKEIQLEESYQYLEKDIINELIEKYNNKLRNRLTKN